MRNKHIYILIVLISIVLQGCSQKVDIKDSSIEEVVENGSEVDSFEIKPFKVVIRGSGLEKIKVENDWIRGNEIWIVYDDGSEQMILKSGEDRDEEMFVGTIINGFPSNDNSKVYFTSVRVLGDENSVFLYDLEKNKLKFISSGSLYNISSDDGILLINKRDKEGWMKTYLVNESGVEIGEYEHDDEESLRNIEYDDTLKYLGRDIQYVFDNYGKVYFPNDFTELAPFIRIDKDLYEVSFRTSYDSSRINEVRLGLSYYAEEFPKVSILGINIGSDIKEISSSLGQGESVIKWAEEVEYEEIQYPYRGYRIALIDSEYYGLQAGRVAAVKVYLDKENADFVESQVLNSLMEEEILYISYDMYRALDLNEKKEETMEGNEDKFGLWAVASLGKFQIGERYIANDSEYEIFQSLEYEKVFEKKYVEEFVRLVFGKDIEMTSDYYTPYFQEFMPVSGKIVYLDMKDGIYDCDIAMYFEEEIKIGKMKLKIKKDDGIIKIISMEYKAED